MKTTVSEMKTTWEEINSKLDTSNEKRIEFKYIAIVRIQNEI